MINDHDIDDDDYDDDSEDNNKNDSTFPLTEQSLVYSIAVCGDWIDCQEK